MSKAPLGTVLSQASGNLIQDLGGVQGPPSQIREVRGDGFL